MISSSNVEDEAGGCALDAEVEVSATHIMAVSRMASREAGEAEVVSFIGNQTAQNGASEISVGAV